MAVVQGLGKGQVDLAIRACDLFDYACQRLRIAQIKALVEQRTAERDGH
jgi:hypothetical protein